MKKITLSCLIVALAALQTTAQIKVDNIKYYATAVNQDHIFPIGVGTEERPLTVSGTIPASGKYVTTWMPGKPLYDISSVSNPISAVSPVGMWAWKDVNNNGEGVAIKVSIPNVSAFALPEKLRLVGWNGNAWIDLSNAATATGNTEDNTLSGTMVNGITAIAIGADLSASPVQFIEVATTKVNNKDGLIKWTVSEDDNLDNYTVEYSIDGRNFHAGKQVPPVRLNSGRHTYEFIDKNLQSYNVDAVYYRISALSNKGSRIYTKVSLIRVNS